MDLEGRSVLLTGASGGIGGAIARALLERGALLKLSARRTEVLDELRAALGSERTEAVPADLSQRDAASRLAERAGAVDVLVANAAVPASGDVLEYTPEQIDRALDVNLRAPLHLARALLPGMLERGSGQLVFIGSLSGKAASPGSALYSATKFGLRGFALALRQDLHGSGVGVTSVFPGFVSEAGLFAEAGVGLPRGVKTVSPEAVAGAVVRGIERDRAEVDVAPLPLRAGAALAGVAPSVSAAVQRRLGGRELADAIARGQAAKR